MDLFEQFDDSQSLFVDNYEPETENIYLANEETALQFICINLLQFPLNNIRWN